MTAYAGRVKISWHATISDGGGVIGSNIKGVLAGEPTPLANVSASSLHYRDTTGTYGTIHIHHAAATDAVGRGIDPAHVSAAPHSPDNTMFYASLSVLVPIIIGTLTLIMIRRQS